MKTTNITNDLTTLGRRVVVSDPGRTRGTTAEGTALKALLTALDLEGGGGALARALFAIVVADNFNPVTKTGPSLQNVTTGDLLDIDGLAIDSGGVEGQKGEIVVDAVCRVPAGSNVGSIDVIDSVGSNAIVVTGSKLQTGTGATNAMTSGENHITSVGLDNTGRTEVLGNVVCEQHTDRRDSGKLVRLGENTGDNGRHESQRLEHGGE